MRKEFVTEQKNKLQGAKNNSLISDVESASKNIDELCTKLDHLLKKSEDSLSIFFNNPEIIDGNNEGTNLSIGNSYCDYIPEEYGYPLVRSMVLENIPVYINSQKISSRIQNGVNNFLQFVDTLQMEYDAINFGIESFWSKNQQRFTSSFESLYSLFDNCYEKYNKFSKLIYDWLDLGDNVLTQASNAQRINSFENIDINGVSMYDILKENSSNLKEIIPTMLESIPIIELTKEYSFNLYRASDETTEEVITADSDSIVDFTMSLSSSNKNSEARPIEDEIKRSVLESLNVKSKSEKILNDLSNLIQSL